MRTLEWTDFDNALLVMERLGWHKGASFGPGRSVCAARALNIAARQRSSDWCDLDEALKYMDIPDVGKASIPRWNDASSTQWRDVERTFRAAAARMRGSCDV